MSNNIYDIMNKLNAVASKDSPQVKTESGGKTLLESTMKEVLNEKYMGFDKTVAAIKKGGSAKDPEAVAASIGREKYGKEKFQAAAAKGKKMGEGLARQPDPYGPGERPSQPNVSTPTRTRALPGMPFSTPATREIKTYKDNYGDDLRPDTAPIGEDDMEEGNLFTGNLAKARAQGKKRDDLDGDGDTETVREGAKPDFLDLNRNGNRKEPMKKAAADMKKSGVVEGQGSLIPGKFYVVTSIYGKIKAVKGPFDDDGEAEYEKAEYSGGGKRDAAVAQWTGRAWNFDSTDSSEQGVAEGFENTPSMIARLFSDNKQLFDMAAQGNITPQLKKLVSIWGESTPWGENTDTRNPEWIDGVLQHLLQNYYPSWKAKQGVTEGTKETSTGRVHKAEPGGYGRRDDDEDGDKKKTEPAVKRGRGRPKKDADSETGEVKKYGNAAALQSFMVGNLPKGKLPGKTTTKHKIKDEPDEKLDEKAPPGAKAERMVKHIKQGYAKDGKLTDKEKGIAYATAWKAKNAGKVEESIPPGFPRSLAKKIYEHFDGNVDSTLNAMWRVHNTIMEQNRSNVSEPPEFSMGAGVKPSRVRITQPEPEFDYGATGKAPKGPSIPPYRPTIDNAEMRQFNRRFKDVMSMPNYVGGHPEGEMGATGNPQNKVVLKKPLAIDTVPAMTVMPDRVPHIQNIPAPSKMSDGGLADKLRNIPGPGNFSGGGGGAKWKEKEDNVFESNTLGIFGKKTNEGRVQGGIWRDLPPKAGEKDVPAPYPDEGPTAPIKTAPVKKAPAAQPQMGTYKGGVWTADPPKPGQVGVPVPQDIDGGSAPAPKSKPVKTQKKAEVDVDGDTGIAEMLNLAGIKAAVTEADLSECGMSSSPISGAMNDDDGRMNISTNMSSDGNKTVTITADGEAAVELMKMLKMAGMNANMGHEDTDVETMSEEKDPRYEASTTPEEEVLPVQTQLKGGNGDVAGKEKKMTPHGYKFADNPLAMKESMSLKLIKEYEGIKKAV